MSSADAKIGQQARCQMCNDKGFVMYVPENEVAPCPKCNPDGMDEVTG